MATLTLQQLFDLAVEHHQGGRLEEAEALYQQVLAQQPAHVQALHYLGFLAHQQGNRAIAVDLIRRAIAIKPDYANAYHNLANALRDDGKTDEAIAAYRQAVRCNPRFADAFNNLGVSLRGKGQLDEAITVFGQAIAINPGHANAYSNLGNALRDTRRLDEAITAYRNAIAIDPNLAEPHANLAELLSDRGEVEDGLAAARRAVTLKPTLAAGWNNLGNILRGIGALDEAIAAYRQAIAVAPQFVDAHSNLLFALQSHPRFTAAAIAQEHRDWNQLYAAPLKRHIAPHRNERDPERRLRIGYVSPDFRDHAVCRFALPLLGAHDRNQFEIFCYSQVLISDSVTREVQRRADSWRSTVGQSDAEVVRAIGEDRIDILVDLAGHTAGNRLLVFARKPAPVQVTYLGYPGTTGMEAIDYRLTDELADPTGLTDAFCSERLIRLPQTAWCYQPPANSPAVSELPALRNGYITFGSFNNFTKTNEALLENWAEILHRVPKSRLLLKALALRSKLVRDRVCEIMRGFGIEAGRLELRGWVPIAGHLAVYHDVDIALDTFPYHGTTTTCEALWMGVPVVTHAGESHVSRVGVSLLSSVGLADLVGKSGPQMAELAVQLARDVERVGELRRRLRERMRQSPLMDAMTFARNIETAYRGMWRTYCEGAQASNAVESEPC